MCINPVKQPIMRDDAIPIGPNRIHDPVAEDSHILSIRAMKILELLFLRIDSTVELFIWTHGLTSITSDENT